MQNKRKLRMMIHTVAFSILACMYISCNDSMERLIKDEYPESGTQLHSGKVMLIVIDGASGSAINEAYNSRRAPNIRSMRENAHITFEGLADSRYANLPEFNNERGWASLMTGITTHGIGLAEEPGSGPKPIEELNTPSFLQRIKQVAANRKSSLYASDNNFYEVFSKDADNMHHISSDQELKDALIDEIAREEGLIPDIILAQFSGVQHAGMEHGFVDQSNAPVDVVLEAIEKIDGYIGEILLTLETRENYKNENWLIIVTSTYGGIYPEMVHTDNFYDDPRLNTFTMMYNYQIESRVIGKPSDNELNYKYFTPVYSGNWKYESAHLADPALFDMDLMGSDKSYTIQFMYQSKENSNRDLTIISKSDRNGSRTGWQIRSRSARFIFMWPRGTEYTREDAADRVNDVKWHTITVVFDKEEDKMKIYTDGILNMHPNHMTPALRDIRSPNHPLTIGKIEGSNTNANANFSITNLQIYDVALPQDFISEYHGITKLEEVKNEYWDNLIGYWPCDREDDMDLGILKDYSQYAALRGDGSTDMILTGTPAWSMGNSWEEYLKPTPDNSYYKAVINNVDIPFQAMQWLGIPISLQWEFEGNVKPFRYTYMENN